MLVVKVIDEYHIRVIHYIDVIEEPDGTLISGSGPTLREMGAAVSGSTMKLLAIIKEKRKLDVKQMKIELLEYLPGVAVYSRRKAIARAESRLHEREYNLYTNNCECLINWAYTDKSESGQVEKAKNIAIGVGLGALAIGVGVGLAAYMLSKKKEPDSEKSDSDEDFDY